MIPVTIIAGYFGAGKTTLINALLSGDHGRRLAVLVNDFGAINIDQDLIVRHDGDTIALSNGCVCCSIRDALGDALDAVIAAKTALAGALRESGLTKAAFARRLGVDVKEVRRMLDPRHATKIPALARALAALDKQIVIEVRDAA